MCSECLLAFKTKLNGFCNQMSTPTPLPWYRTWDVRRHNIMTWSVLPKFFNIYLDIIKSKSLFFFKSSLHTFKWYICLVAMSGTSWRPVGGVKKSEEWLEMLADKTLSALVFSLSYDRNIWLYYLLILCYLLCLSIINLEIFFPLLVFVS